MGQIEDKYISLLTDYGFKRIFGTTMNKDLLISFLNSLFDGEQVIVDVKYLNSEHVGDIMTERKAIFDVYCENEKGEKFIVEMQNAFQEFFKDRSIFYSTYPIREQAKKGSEWDFHLNHVYTIALLNFRMNDPAFKPGEIIHKVQLCDVATNKVFYHKLDYIYIELANVHKTEDELETMFDKWMFVLKNLGRLEQRPKALQERIFTKLFKEAEIAAFDPIAVREYEDSIKAYRDIKNSLDTAMRQGIEKGMRQGIEKGRAEGRAEGEAMGAKKEKYEIARKMQAMSLPIEAIMKATGLDREEILNFTE